MSAKLVVLISGNGSNLQAILDACAGNDLPASVVAVISNKAEASVDANFVVTTSVVRGKKRLKSPLQAQIFIY